jgi:hypothetical protein
MKEDRIGNQKKQDDQFVPQWCLAKKVSGKDVGIGSGDVVFHGSVHNEGTTKKKMNVFWSWACSTTRYGYE